MQNDTFIEEYLNYPVQSGPLKALDIKTMHGANYFSGGNVVVVLFDLCEYDEVFTNDIPGFYEKLKKMLPSLYDHFCSVGKPGGFFIRVKDGTLLGHVTEHVAIELQTLAGIDGGFGKTRSTDKQGVYNVVFRFIDEIAGVYTAKAALNLVNSILLDQPFDVSEIVRNLINIREKRLLGPSTQAIVDKAEERNIPYLRLDAYNLVQLGTGKFLKRIRATITSDTNLIAVETADNTFLTTLMLKDAGIPVPETIKAKKAEDVLSFFKKLQAPVVIKPNEGKSGKRLSLNLRNENEILQGFEWIRQKDESLIAQEFITGNTYRILIIDYKFVAAAKLIPPIIKGDGKNTIAKLIEQLNSDPERGIGDKSRLSIVEIDEVTERLLFLNDLTLETILPEGKSLALKVSGNLRLGGSAIDVTEEVHPMNKFFAERAAKVIGLNIAGIDIITQDLKESILENTGSIIEVNAAPDFRMHLKPSIGKKRNVAENLLDMLFPENTKTRIPLFSITGTAGKTTTVNLLSYCLKLAGYLVGRTSTDGLFIGDKCLMKGDMTYPEHVALVLKDPTIDCGVLETSREGILRRGLGYKFADFGIVLNVDKDHIGGTGAENIRYIEDLAYAKSVVAEQVYDEGFVILNADNELVVEMAERVYSNIAYFSHFDNNQTVRLHVDKGGLAVVIDENILVILDASKRIEVLHIDKITLTFKGKAQVNYDNILATVAALYAFGLPVELIQTGLKTFYSEPSILPGRMNFITINDFKVLLDYAHNEIGFNRLKDFLKNHQEYKLGVVDAAGDRTDEDIIQLGKIAAETYDEIYLYEGFDLRGRKEGEIVSLLKKGVISTGFADEKVSVFQNPEKAWINALKQGKNGKLIVILSGRSEKTLEVIKNFITPEKQGMLKLEI
jgi:cyanophycin synthetase